MRAGAGGPPPNIGRIYREETQKVKRKVHRKSLGGPEPHERFEPLEWSDPMRKVFRNPNGPDTMFDFWNWHYLFRKLTGSANWWIRRNKFGIVKEMYVIPTHWMRMQTGHHGDPSSYTVQSPWGHSETIPFDDVVSFMEYSPLNRWEGFAVNQAIGTWIDTYEASTTARLAQYKNGAIPSYHMKLGESYGDPDDQQLARYYAKINQRLRGEFRTNTPLITGADVDITPLGIKPVDMDYSQTEEQIRDMTLCAYDVPKVIVGLLDNMTYGSVAGARAEFYQGALNPDLMGNGQCITEKMIAPTPGYEDGVFFWDERTADDPELKLRTIESRRQGGSITPNEERTIYGDEPYEHGGDDPLINGQEVPWKTGGRDQVKDAIAAVGGSDDAKAQSDQAKQIMEMQAAVTEGKLSRGMAIANVVTTFGVDAEQARALFDAAGRQQAGDDAKLSLSFNRALSGSSGSDGGYAMRQRYGIPEERDTVEGRLREKLLLQKAWRNGGVH